MTRLVCRRCASDILNWIGIHCPFCGRKLEVIENEDFFNWDKIGKVKQSVRN